MAAKKPEIVMRDPRKLIPHTNNARTHTAEQVEQLVASLEEFGWTNPVLISEKGVIIAGHGRVAAAMQRGDKTIPTLTLAGLTDEQIRAYVIADNKLALNAGWDANLLKVELEELRDLGYDIGVTGFSADELTMIFQGWESDIKPPGDGAGDEQAKGKIVVTCENPDDVESLRETLQVAAHAKGFIGVEFK